MTQPEANRTVEQGNNSGSGDAKRPKQEVSVPYVQELFSWVKFKLLMEQESPGSTNLAKLREVEEKLGSSETKLKLEATEELDKLWAIKEKVDGKAKKIETAVQLVEEAKITDEKKQDLRDVAGYIDGVFAKAHAGEVIEQTELERTSRQVQEMARQMGIKESAEGLEEIVAKVHYMEHSRSAQQFVSDQDLYVSPVQEYEKEFKVGQEGEVLKLRDVSGDERNRLQGRLDRFKEKVAEEIVTADARKLDALSTDDLMKRLKETTYWQANMKYLQGSREWVGNKNIGQLRDMLGRVEAQYQALLEKKLTKEITSKYTDQHIEPGLVGESLRQVLKNKRRFLRTEYDFEKNVPQGKSQSEVIENEVVVGAKKMQVEVQAFERGRGSERRTTQERTGNNRADTVNDPNAVTYEQSEDYRHQRADMNDTLDIFKELGITAKDLSEGADDPEMRAKWAKMASESSLHPSRKHKISRALEEMQKQFESGRMGKSLSETQVALERLKRHGNYSKFLIKFKAYVERVGLREASSDWDFAIMMREAKEEISRVNPDAGEKLDQWQEALFAPNFLTLDEKTFFGMMPKIMNQSRLEHEFSEKYANWEAMQVTGPDGKKKVVSVAAFYQLLQREDVAKRILDADTNGNDSVIQQILVEHIWGEGAKLNSDYRLGEKKPMKMWVTFADGREPVTDIDVSYFTMDGTPHVDDNQNEKLQLHEFIDQSMWMTHYAKTIWHYSGEWETFLRDFPVDQLSQANKRLMNIGAAFRDYGLDYGKFDVGYENLAKAGILLQDFRTYKAKDMIEVNLRHKMYDAHIVTAKRGDQIGAALWQVVQKRAFIDDDYNPVVGMRSVEEIRLMGNLPKSEEEAWNWFKRKQEVLGRKGMLSFSDIEALKRKNFDSLSSTEEAWVVQANEVNKWIDDLRAQRAKLEGEHGLNLTKEELGFLTKRQSLLTTGEYNPNGVSLDDYLRNFEYSSIIDHSELRKGSDPLDYQKYSEAKIDAAKAMTEVLGGSPSLERISELYNIMSGYMPPEQRLAWFKAYAKRRVLLRTTQVVKYDIAMTDLEYWHLRKERGEETAKEPPEAIVGFNPAQYKIKDERGDTWNVVGADGYKVTKKKKQWGNHMWKTRRIPGLSAKDVETQMQLFVGNRWLPNIESGEEIVESTFGLNQVIDNYYKNRGINLKDQPQLAKNLKKYGSKLVILLRKHPLFDDPQWAFWSILNELWEYSKEVGKETGKSVAGGH